MNEVFGRLASSEQFVSRMLLPAQVAVTWALVGLIWTIQLVHYPLFRLVGEANFSSYHAEHTQWISVLVVPLMLTELLIAGLLMLVPPADQLGLSGASWAGIGLTLVGVAWLSTFALSVPQHGVLANGFDSRAHVLLVSTNWIRTVAWTLRAVLALLLVVEPPRP